MTRPLRFTSELVMVACLVASGLVHADNDDTVDYREHIMKTMGEQAAAIDMIIKQKAPPNNFNTHIHILAIAASTALKAFEPKVIGGHAKPEIWANWADFSKRMNELTTTITALAKSADAGGITAVAPKMQASLTCKGCHDTYRQPMDN
jgi:cytochrome c556